MRTQAELGGAFQALHAREGAFIIPNPWDAGTARTLANMGFEALATTSSGMAYAAGKLDHQVSRDDVLAHCRMLAASVDVPINADLGNCFGDDPPTVAETIRLAAETGIAGASVEDMKGDRTIYDIGLAAERVRAAAEAAQALPFPFVLTARAENYLVGKPDLDDTIKRLLAYEEAGADVLYAPGLRTREDISAVVEAVDRPVNVISGIPGFTLTMDDLGELGVRRVSLGSALTSYAATSLFDAAREMLDRGTFSFVERNRPLRKILAGDAT
jgi:2-methylisocitrate lyase-like PEP mutase family enzyme